MKKTIFIAMMLIGMMGSAQTISNPVLVDSLSIIKDKEWYMYKNDPSVIFYSNTDMTQIKAYSTALVIKLIGKDKKPDNTLYNGDSVMYEWYITDKKVIRLILNDISSLIAIREYE
jgi:hypothetical protein